jgi:CHASE3 domain sensor protein
MHWSIQNKMVIVFSTVVLFIVLLSLVTYRNAYTLIDANQLVIQTQKVQEELEAILSQIKDAETGQRGFLLTGDERYLEPYNSARASLAAMILRIEFLVADNQTQISHIKVLKPLVETKLRELDQTIVLRRTEGLPAALEIVRFGSGKENMDQIRRVIGVMRGIEDGLLSKRIDKVNEENNSTAFAIVVATLLNIFLLAFGYFAITKFIRERQEFEDKINLLNQSMQQNAVKQCSVTEEMGSL